jgi:spermidine synthase
MRVIARFAGPNGEIRILEEPSTGARSYCEGGVNQSRVLAGGLAGIDYIALMAQLLANGGDILLLGCGGGALGSILHRQGRRVTVVDVNPLSFQLARTFFWMPHGIECVTLDMRDFVRDETRTFDSVGIDVGGPRFSYEKVLQSATAGHIRRLLRERGRIAINISCQEPSDPVPCRIADIFAAEGLNVWLFKENDEAEMNAIILASARSEKPPALFAMANGRWSLARLGGEQRRGRPQTSR